MHLRKALKVSNVPGYARGFNDGGARGIKWLKENNGPKQREVFVLGECLSAARKAMAKRLGATGSISIFTIDCFSVWADVLSNTARHIGFGLCGRDKSGVLAPASTSNRGIKRLMKRTHRICLTKTLMPAEYQIL